MGYYAAGITKLRMFLYKGQPGANFFRSNITAILVLVFAVILFSYISHAEKKIYEVAIDRTVSDINAALALVMYQYIIRGETSRLPLLNGENPFVFLAMYKQLPVNYRGAVRKDTEMLINSWYYDLGLREVIYRAESGDMRYVLKFYFDDKDFNSKFDAGVDRIEGLRLVRV